MTQKLKTITQDELEHLLAIEAEYRALRSDIRERALAGAVVEPGAHTVEVETREERRITQETLRMTLGDFAEPIIEAVPRTTKHFMFVRGGPETDEHGHLGSVFDPYVNKEDGEIEEKPRMSLPEQLEVLTERLGTKIAGKVISQIQFQLELVDDPDAECL